MNANENQNNKRKNNILVVVFASLFLLAIIAINFEKFEVWIDWINEKINILAPILIGSVIAYLCTPLVRFFQKKPLKKMKNNRTKRTLSILFAYLVVFLFLATFITLVLPQLFTSMEDLLDKTSNTEYLESYINDINQILERFQTSEGNMIFPLINVDKVNGLIQAFFAGSESIIQWLATMIITYGRTILVSVKNILIGFLLSIYFVISKERLYAQSNKILASVFSKEKHESILNWFRFADKTFGGFIIGKMLDATTVMVLCSIVFGIAKIPYSTLIALLIGISNIIPFFGPFIGAIPSGLIVLVTAPQKLIPFIILLLIVQQFDANIIEPKIVGDKTGLSSLGVLVAVTVMSGYFGTIGLFFGVPIFAIVCSITMNCVDKKLAQKNLPTELSEYYSPTSIVDPLYQSEGFVKRALRSSKDKILAAKARICKKNKPGTDVSDIKESKKTGNEE